jgi:type I restriction enzyme M protein
MLDQETKRKIDNARDILVGKVPDPKSQVEQITIALIYKFMDDMDKESIALGGKAAFFKGEYEKYTWSRIFDPKLGGFDLIKLYSEAITTMNHNENIPQLFRDIFKNAFLPYRDPETLKSFLKEINEFRYDHSEKLGDAFEYLLSVLGSQGDAGQFRTPRHIIDFIVSVVDPKKNESILDPACGTAGFLISSFKHILHENTKERKGDCLTMDERKRLMNSLVGYDISPDMVRLSLVNLYLHGFQTPKIHEYDTLTSEEKWNETYDVILANPPFMTPKGGIRPHKRFSVQANRSEVLFVDYIMEHISTNGRGGVIVPEGIIFQSANAYKALRKLLVDTHLFAVVSLPSGVFQPYAGVKTSILLMDRTLAQRAPDILFVKLESDGFDLGAQRRPNGKSDLPAALSALLKFRRSLYEGKECEFSEEEKRLAHRVAKGRIAEGGDYNLSGERYKEVAARAKGGWEMVELGEVCEINPKKSELKELNDEMEVSFVPMSDVQEKRINFEAKEKRKLREVINGYTYFRNNDVLLAKITPCFENGKSGIAKSLKNEIGFGSTEFIVIRPSCKLISELIYYFISDERFLKIGMNNMTGSAGQKRVLADIVRHLKIPLPPLSVQQEIVAEIEGFQKIIDGARQVVENYKPRIKVDEGGEVVELGEAFNKITDSINPQENNGEVKYIGLENIESGNGNLIGNFVKEISEIKSTKLKFLENDILYGKLRPNLNKVWLASFSGICSTDFIVLRAKNELVVPKFYSFILQDAKFNSQVLKGVKGAQLPRISFDYLSTLEIPLPPVDVQKEIVARIENEQKLVDANKKLIELFDGKIKEKIAEVWG